MPTRLTVLSGPSGVGKGTVVARLREAVPQVWVSVSCTTRAPRPGEIEGLQYHFVTADDFAQLVARQALLEHAEFAGHCYGTPRDPVQQHLDAGVPTLLEIELQGARQIRRAMPEARLVFLAPPSVDVLVQRLTGRRTESDAELAARMAIATTEMAAADEFDHVVVNDDLDRAVAEVAALVTAP
jgi:guanylate kinase